MPAGISARRWPGRSRLTAQRSFNTIARPCKAACRVFSRTNPMALRRPRIRGMVLSSLLAVTILCGCSKTEAPPTGDARKDAAVVLNNQAVTAKVMLWPSDARHQSFEQATPVEPPQDAFRPVDVTKAGKNVAKMYEQIAGENGLWKQILFVDGEGKTVQYTVTLKTDLGDVVIELWPDVAPNHVRNFLALTKAVYYDGLVFHATARQQLQDGTGARHLYEVIEAGCPLGTGEA